MSKPIDATQLWHTLQRWAHPSTSPALVSSRANVPVLDPAASAEQEQALRMLQTIDAEQGLGRVLGKVPTYLQLLRKFSRGQRDFVTEFQVALGRDAQEAVRLAHTLKGAAGNLGAVGLATAAGRLEAVTDGLPQGDTTLEVMLQDVSRCLQDTLSELNALLDAVDQPQTATPTDALSCPQTVLQRAQTLLGLLEDDDPKALDELKSQAPDLQQLLGPTYGPLAEAIEDFEFAAAAQKLRTLLSNPGAPSP